MALIRLPGYLPYPDARTWGAAGTPALSQYVLDVAGERVTWVVRATKGGNLRKVGFRTGSVTTAVTLNIRVETVNAEGNATGTLWATNTIGTVVSPAANTWYWVTLTADATLSIGSLFAICIDFTGVGNLQISGTTTATGRLGGIPYLNTRDAGVWTRVNDVPNVGLEYSDASRPWCDALPIMSVTNRTFNNGSTPDERGIRFKFPFACEIMGAIVRASISTAPSAYTITLYDSADAILSSPVQDTDIQISGRPPVFVPFPEGLIAISANTLYRLTVSPTAASNISLVEYDVDSTGTMESHSGGLEIYRTERTDAGVWTDTPTGRSLIVPLVASIADALQSGAIFLTSRKRYNQLADPLLMS